MEQSKKAGIALFKQYPYKGWLILAVLLWGAVLVRYYQRSTTMSPQNMARSIEKDIRYRERAFEGVKNNRELVSKIFSGQLSKDDVTRLTELPIGLYAYRNDALVFWNNNKVLTDCTPPEATGGEKLFQNERGKFVKLCFTPDSTHNREKLVALIPIVTIYPFENNYLHSSFEAGDYIPTTAIVSSRPGKNSYGVRMPDGSTVFFVSFLTDVPSPWTPGTIIIVVGLFAVLFSVFWLQLITTWLARNRSYWQGFFVLGGAILAFRILSYRFGLPFNLESLPIFQPQLYATSQLLNSLGQLLINTLLFLWLVLYIARHARLDFIVELKLRTPARLACAAGIILALFVYCFSYINITSSLITDSSISFDVSHFYTISTYTIIGLSIVALITIASFIVVYILSIQLSILLPNKWLKYLLLAFIGIVMIYFSDTVTPVSLSYSLLLWLLLFIILLDIRWLKPVVDLFSPQMIFWAGFVFLFCTGILQYFNFTEEHANRLHFAETVVQQRDDIAEFSFRATGTNIAHDPLLRSFLTQPDKESRDDIDERFEALYLGGHLNNYQSKLLIFDKEGKALFNNDTLSYPTLTQMVNESLPTPTPYLYYRENARDGRYYLAQVPVSVPDSAGGIIIGYVFIDMSVKESTGETVYPELLQPGTVSGNRNEKGYSYAVYVGDRLLTQTSDYNFPVYLSDTLLGEHKFTEYPSSSELRYKAENGRTVFVIRYHRLWLETITLFSYLFGIHMVLALLSVLYRIYLLYIIRSERAEKLINFTLRRRIHVSFLGIVFVSFLIIGIITIVFFTLQYKQNSRKKQQLVMQLVERSVLQYLKDNNGHGSALEYSHLANTPAYRYFITELATAQKIDINIFHASGVLNVTSQEDIYDKALFARIIPPDAYYALSEEGQQFLTQDEHLGKLNYVSCYKPIMNRNGNVLGFINVPFFSSEKELNFQISGILIGLINLYAFVFLFSGIMTVFITRWITKSLSIVIKSFSRFSLDKNEPVTWPYDDEIGLLVKEYNKMVKKAEENARLLAQNEREGAWREMAQQVAHEIKNPLTPMKLNIQYLQQALVNSYDNVNELAKKVSESLLEQINNLSYIASEFSDFAKMPEARPERFDLNELLLRTVELYKNRPEVKVTCMPYAEKLEVYTDKSQLLRVCNNLLENAVQAIPADRKGLVEITLKKNGSYAVVMISDNGTGIEQEAVSKIFQPYFTTKTSGTGLGLAMTKKIIEFWKGSIDFETTAGKGTTFYISIPLANGMED